MVGSGEDRRHVGSERVGSVQIKQADIERDLPDLDELRVTLAALHFRKPNKVDVESTMYKIS